MRHMLLLWWNICDYIRRWRRIHVFDGQSLPYPPRATDCVCANCCFFLSSSCFLSWKFYESNIASGQRDRSLERIESSMYVGGELFIHHQSTIGPQKLKLLSEDNWGHSFAQRDRTGFRFWAVNGTYQFHLRLKIYWATMRSQIGSLSTRDPWTKSRSSQSTHER